MSKPITDLQAVELLQTIMEEIPAFKVYYTMKEMRLQRLHRSAVNYMRACVAIHSAGLPITTGLIGALVHKSVGNTLTMLHSLGDKNCLVLKRALDKRSYEWAVHPLFLKYFYGDKDE